MTPEHWQQLDTLFQAVIELDSDAREAYLNMHCSDSKLRAEVESLIFNDTKNEDEIRKSVFTEAAYLLNTARIGEKVGAYTIDEEIGHGGMGTVYVASRSDALFKKKVAIKILHNILASNEERKRFETERQILANMEHANIARLLDGGSCDDGSPYLVMEYVDGHTIDVYCKQHQLSVKERIKLFFQICNAIQYAHEHKILHCDIKPSNILVSHDGIPKLVDFGISQLLSLSGNDNNIESNSTRILAMTPAYASPEQLAGAELNESSDVYTLALVLYEILTNHHPEFDENNVYQPPGKPSKLDSDLNAILMCALSKKQVSRYQSVSELADDLEKYLDKQPVNARHSTSIYRLTRFSQRNPAWLATIFLTFITSMLIVYGLQQSNDVTSKEVQNIIRAHTSMQGQLKTSSIAVLPFFINKNQQLAKGITEDLIRDLSKIKQFNVIANNSARQYDSRKIDIRRLQKELKIDYFVKGNINIGKDEIGIEVTLFNIKSNNKLWQKTYRRPIIDLFDLQKLISSNIVEAFNLSISDTEYRLLAKRYTTSLTAYEYFLQGLTHYGQRFQQANQLARENVEKAITLDPNFARAYAVLANTHRADFINRWTKNPNDSIQLAEKFVRTAIELDPDLAQAHFVKALIHREQKQHNEAMASAANAIMLNPNYADAFILLASVMCYSNSPTNSIDLVDKAVRLNPNYPTNYNFHLGQCQFVLGKYQDAIYTLEETVARNPTLQRTNLWLAASYAQVGRIEDARWVVKQLLSWNPDLTIKHVKSVTPFSRDIDMKPLLQGLIKAGLK